jgi:hypothetical protein
VNRRRPNVLQIIEAKTSATIDRATAAHAMDNDPIEKDQGGNLIARAEKEDQGIARTVLKVGRIAGRVGPLSIVVATNAVATIARTSIPGRSTNRCPLSQ